MVLTSSASGRVPIDVDLRVTGHPDVLVLGDAAHLIDKGKPLPPPGQGPLPHGAPAVTERMLVSGAEFGHREAGRTVVRTECRVIAKPTRAARVRGSNTGSKRFSVAEIRGLFAYLRQKASNKGCQGPVIAIIRRAQPMRSMQGIALN